MSYSKVESELEVESTAFLLVVGGAAGGRMPVFARRRSAVGGRHRQRNPMCRGEGDGRVKERMCQHGPVDQVPFPV